MEREIGMMEERVKSGKRKIGISGLRLWKREEGGFPVVDRERIVGDGAGEKHNCGVSRGGRGGQDESENGESGFSGMGGRRDFGYAEGWEVNRKQSGQGWSEIIQWERRGGGGKIAGLRGRLSSEKMAGDGRGRVEQKRADLEVRRGGRWWRDQGLYGRVGDGGSAGS